MSMVWKMGFVLPNLQIGAAIETEFVAIAPFHDPRVEALQAENRAAKILLHGFRDNFGNVVRPSALIFRSGAPDKIIEVGALLGFRNLVAFSHLMHAWPDRLTKVHSSMPIWSDYFDIYPMRPTKDGKDFVIYTPSLRGFDGLAGFRGHTSPLLPHPRTVHFSMDKELCAALLRLWRRRFEKGRFGQWKTKALFRSLEIAFQASGVPSANYSTLFDYGVNISLWVSAFEVLSHPPGRRQANFSTVVDLLSRYQFSEPSLQARRCCRLRKKDPKLLLNLPQRLYRELYFARNRFAHGNPVSRDHLHIFHDKTRLSLTAVASLLYRALLYAHLETASSKVKVPTHDFDGGTYEEALLKAVQ